MDKLAPGYALTREQLVALTPLLTACPITYEHVGIFDAVKRLDNKNLEPLQARVWKELNDIAKTDDSRCATIGEVIDYWESPEGNWWCTFYINAEKWESVIWMVEKGFLRGLSLTHMVHNTHCIPYEVSLCFEPARSGCYVYFLHVNLFEVEQYKRNIISKAIREPLTKEHTPGIKIMAASTDTTPVPMDTSASLASVSEMTRKPLIEQAMDTLPEESRRLIAARLTEMCARVDEAKAAQKNAENARDSAKKEKEQALVAAKNGEVNVGMLKSQLAIMRDNLGEELISNYHITPQHCAPLLESNDPNDVRRVVDRVLLAANAKLMMATQISRASDPTNKKRKAEPEEQSRATLEFKVPEVAIVTASKKAAASTPAPSVVTSSSPEDILMRAMSNTFEC